MSKYNNYSWEYVDTNTKKENTMNYLAFFNPINVQEKDL